MTEEQAKPYQLNGQYAATAEFMYASLKNLINKYSDDDSAAKIAVNAMSYHHIEYMKMIFMRCQMQDEANAAVVAAPASDQVTN